MPEAKGVRLIVHNETSGGIQNYERQLDSAFALYQSLGLDAIKSGYVTDLTGEGHSHYSQYMVRPLPQGDRDGGAPRHHAGRPRADARHRRAPHLAQHDEPRGGAGAGVQRLERRRRQSAGARDHSLLYPAAGRARWTSPRGSSTSCSSGAADGRRPEEPRVRTTLAKQLALYVVLYSPLQMAADLPENYEGQPAFQFIRDVAVDWDTTRVIDGRIGDYVVVARRERGGQSWFLGAITDEEGRTLDVPLSFLTPGPALRGRDLCRRSQGELAGQSLAGHHHAAPVTSATRLRVVLAPGGGQAIRIRPAR